MKRTFHAGMKEYDILACMHAVGSGALFFFLREKIERERENKQLAEQYY